MDSLCRCLPLLPRQECTIRVVELSISNDAESKDRTVSSRPVS